MIVLGIIMVGTFYVLSLVDDEDYIYWRVFAGVMAFCVVWTVGLALL
jgi:hypothetical protein